LNQLLAPLEQPGFHIDVGGVGRNEAKLNLPPRFYANFYSKQSNFAEWLVLNSTHSAPTGIFTFIGVDQKNEKLLASVTQNAEGGKYRMCRITKRV
jgi:hypothetical protein